MSAISADALGTRYGRRWALRGCTLDVREGSVVGLVGANGAGKSTFLHLTVGLLEPSEGSLEVLGGRPGVDPTQLAKVGFVAQDAPVYGALSVADHLRLGAHMNPGWDDAAAKDRVRSLGLDLRQRAGKLSGGQRSQLALTLAMGKRPELLVLDEPVSSLDPLARRAFLTDVMELMADHQPTIVLSSHLLSDVERVCDHLILMAEGQVQLHGPVDDLLAQHKLLTGPRRDERSLPSDQLVVRASHTDRQTTVLVRTTAPILDPAWVVADIGLEDLVLAYMARSPTTSPAQPSLAAVPS
jgi:ABC-2 type transport system ATP-binding protein